MVSRAELSEVIGERTLYISDTKKLVQAVAAFLLEQNQVDDIESLMRDVIAYRAKHGFIEATAVSAYPLSSIVKADIMRELEVDLPDAKSYILNERIDPSLVGGVRIEMANEELDLTVRSKLNTLKRLTSVRSN
jgi:F0F1-type ATP synthase delta subunit